VRPDGSVVWALANLTFLRDEAGRPLSWVGQFQDITGRRAAEEALRASEARHRLVVRNLPRTGVLVFDRELRCVLSEGRHPDDPSTVATGLLGRHLRDVFSPALLAALEPHVRAALAGSSGQAEAYSTRAGRVVAAEVAPHRDEDGAVGGALVVVRDVTEQRAAERARHDAERRFQVAFERAPIGMAIVGLDGRLQRSNDALRQITGYTAEQLEAMGPFGLVDPEDRPTVAAALRDLAGEREKFALEHRSRHADGSRLWMQIETAVIRDEAGVPLYTLVQAQDVTARRDQESALRHMADHDALTGLLNRRAFQRAVEQHVERTQRYGAAGAMLMHDLDGLKLVNDSLGPRPATT
jgi:PAS domain S-box-containing protein